MENNIESKKEKVQEQLEKLLPQMALYFKCEENDIKISKINFYNGNFSAAISYRYIDKERSDLRKIITSIYYFDIDGEYLEKEGIWYEGTFYTYDNVTALFDIILQEIEELNNN